MKLDIAMCTHFNRQCTQLTMYFLHIHTLVSPIVSILIIIMYTVHILLHVLASYYSQHCYVWSQSPWTQLALYWNYTTPNDIRVPLPKASTHLSQASGLQLLWDYSLSSVVRNVPSSVTVYYCPLANRMYKVVIDQPSSTPHSNTRHHDSNIHIKGVLWTANLCTWPWKRCMATTYRYASLPGHTMYVYSYTWIFTHGLDLLHKGIGHV